MYIKFFSNGHKRKFSVELYSLSYLENMIDTKLKNYPVMVKTRVTVSDFTILADIAKNQQTSVYQLLRGVVKSYISSQKIIPNREG